MFRRTVNIQEKQITDLKNINKELNKENKALYEENKENRYYLEELEDYKNKAEKLHDEIIQDLLNLQEISRLGLVEAQKDVHRNIIINRIIKKLVADYQSNN